MEIVWLFWHWLLQAGLDDWPQLDPPGPLPSGAGDPDPPKL